MPHPPLDPVFHFPGGYEAVHRRHLNLESPSLVPAEGVRIEPEADAFYVLDTSRTDRATVVAGPIARAEDAALLAHLYNAEWRYCRGVAEWFAELDGRLYSAGPAYPEGEPAIERGSLEPRTPQDWHHHQEVVRRFVEQQWPSLAAVVWPPARELPHPSPRLRLALDRLHDARAEDPVAVFADALAVLDRAAGTGVTRRHIFPGEDAAAAMEAAAADGALAVYRHVHAEGEPCVDACGLYLRSVAWTESSDEQVTNVELAESIRRSIARATGLATVCVAVHYGGGRMHVRVVPGGLPPALRDSVETVVSAVMRAAGVPSTEWRLRE
jgi:hypothetical protein